jgi:hypothetical protein
MIPYQNGLLERIQDAVCDFIDSTDDEVDTFSLTIEIRADSGVVFIPKVIKEGGEQ